MKTEPVKARSLTNSFYVIDSFNIIGGAAGA